MLDNSVATRQQQRHAAIAWLSCRTPGEAARALIQLVADPAALAFLGGILARRAPLTLHDRERLVQITVSLTAEIAT